MRHVVVNAKHLCISSASLFALSLAGIGFATYQGDNDAYSLAPNDLPMTYRRQKQPVLPPSSRWHELGKPFLDDVKSFPWFEKVGAPNPSVRVLPNVEAAMQVYKASPIWKQQAELIEFTALKTISDEEIDIIFSDVGYGLDNLLELAYEKNLKFPGSHAVMIEAERKQAFLHKVKRDLAWAAVEAVIDRKDFFTHQIAWYRGGRCPCAWDGKFPHGNAVVF